VQTYPTSQLKTRPYLSQKNNKQALLPPQIINPKKIYIYIYGTLKPWRTCKEVLQNALSVPTPLASVRGEVETAQKVEDT